MKRHFKATLIQPQRLNKVQKSMHSHIHVQQGLLYMCLYVSIKEGEVP